VPRLLLEVDAAEGEGAVSGPDSREVLAWERRLRRTLRVGASTYSIGNVPEPIRQAMRHHDDCCCTTAARDGIKEHECVCGCVQLEKVKERHPSRYAARVKRWRDHAAWRDAKGRWHHLTGRGRFQTQRTRCGEQIHAEAQGSIGGEQVVDICERCYPA